MSNKRDIFYEEVFWALNKAKIDYVVCGGVAVILYGFARLTVDLDLIVGLEKENLEKVYDLLNKLNYKPKTPIKKEEFIDKEKLRKLAEEKNMKVVSFYNLKDPLKVVDICVNLPKISEILKRKGYIKVKNLTIPIISIDRLIEMKKTLARPQDLIDVENLKKIKKDYNPPTASSHSSLRSERAPKAINEHLIYILKKSTPYQRMVWLKKAFEFWKNLKKKKFNLKNKKYSKDIILRD